jgi:hypothetical protein
MGNRVHRQTPLSLIHSSVSADILLLLFKSILVYLDAQAKAS